MQKKIYKWLPHLIENNSTDIVKKLINNTKTEKTDNFYLIYNSVNKN
jgi:hypothetical protein